MNKTSNTTLTIHLGDIEEDELNDLLDTLEGVLQQSSGPDKKYYMISETTITIS